MGREKKIRRTFLVKLEVEVEITGKMPPDNVLYSFANECVQEALDGEGGSGSDPDNGWTLRISDSWGCVTACETTEKPEED